MTTGSGPVPIMLAGWLLLAVAAALIIARLYLRISIQRRRLLASDYVMIAGWSSALATVSLTVVLMHDKALEPDLDSTLEGYEGSPEEITEIYKVYWIFNLPLFTTFYLCKGALLSMYLEIFPKFMVKRRIFLWGTVVYVAAAYAVSVLALFLLCTPLATYWDLRPESTCPPSKNKVIFIIAWVLHFTGDFLVFMLPWLIIQGINLRRSLKLGIYCTLLFGIVTMTFSLLRFVLVIRSQVYDVGPISLQVLWSVLECNLGLNITCLPSLRPYFSRNGDNSPRNSNRGSSKVTDTIRTIGKIRTRNVRSNTLARTLDYEAEDSGWSEGKRSHSSDVELVQTHAQSDTARVEDVAV